MKYLLLFITSLLFIVNLSTVSAAAQLSSDELTCLTYNIYHEARGEGIPAQRAVAWVTMNRVISTKYPNSICDVVYQSHRDKNGNPIKHKCQFSWYCDGKSDEINDVDAYLIAEDVAFNVFLAHHFQIDPTDGAVMYHADYVQPSWKNHYQRTVQIDTHIYYKPKEIK